MSLSVIFHSAPAWYGTGYGVQSKNFIVRMIDDGHEVVLMSTVSVQGLTWNGITHIPGGGDKYAAAGMLEWPKRVKTDLLFTLFDIWPFPLNTAQKMAEFGTAWAPIAPVDHDPIPQEVVNRLKLAPYPIAMSPHGFREMQRVGLEHATYIPHGVDTHLFRPGPQNKHMLGASDDKFVVGVIATNIEPLDRKGWFPTLETFGRLHARHPDTILYVHASPVRDDGGLDLLRIAEQFNFRGALHVPDMWTLTAGIPDMKMVELYNSFDVMMILTRGEGFCVPLIEAQACGKPVIVTDFTAPMDLVGAGWKIPVVGKRYTPMNSFWAEPSVDDADKAIEECYQLWKAGKLKDQMERKAREFAKTFEFDLIYDKHMRPFLEKVENDIQEKQNAAQKDGNDGVRQEAVNNLSKFRVSGGKFGKEKGNGRGGGRKRHSPRSGGGDGLRQVPGDGLEGEVPGGPECHGDRQAIREVAG